MPTKPLAGVVDDPLHPLSQGCVCHLLMNEGAGSLAYDVSGHGNHGALKNMSPNAQDSGWGGSKFGGGLAFDGSNDYVDCGNINDLGSSFTISIWSKTLQKITTHQCLLSKKPDAVVWWAMTVNDSDYEFNPGYYNFQFDDDATKVSLLSDTRMDDDQWHHAVITRDSEGYILYVDTIVHDTAANNGSLANSGNFEIGATTDGSFYLNGSIDNVRIYNRALSVEEIKKLYHDPICNLMRIPAWQLYSPIAGLSIPVAMHYYEMLRA